MEIHAPMLRILSSLYERLGLNAYVEGDFAKAESWFRRLEAAEPDSIRVLRNLGVILLAKGELSKAKAYLVREEALFGHSFHRHAGLADLAWAAGEREEAGRRYAAALAEPEARKGGRHAASRPLLEARLGLCGDPAAFARAREGLSVFQLGEAAREAGAFPKAYDHFLKAVDLDPSNWLALNNAGSLALNQLAQPEQAVALLERAFAFSPNSQVGRNLQIAREALEEGKGARPKKGPKAAKGSLR